MSTLPSTLHNGFSRGWVELLQFFRDKTAMVFTFSFPALLLVLFGTIFGNEYNDFGISGAQIFSASMIAYGIVSTAFITMGVGIAVDREDGTLKRLRGTPVTATAYFIGKWVFVAVASLVEVVVLLAIGVLAFDMPLPDAGGWLTLVWLFLLSVISCTLLGIAASSLVRHARTAGAILNVPVVALQFISGIFINPITQLPDWMITVASVFPIKWIGQGFRSVFLPDAMAVQEAGGAWELGRVALVLGVWSVVGLILCLATFRWSDRRNG